MSSLIPEENIVRELCLSNGIQYSQVESNGSAIKELEMFFSGYPAILGLKYFTHLTTLVIVGQTIEKIENLSHLSELKELWIAECKLHTIQGLDNNKKLSKLYLYDNKIKEIENISHLRSLDILWLSNNLIRTIKGIGSMQWLRELNLAENLIESIGNSLDSLRHLEVLNLSGNRLSCFKDLTHLAALPKLTDLSLKDPMFSSNPVCLLCNYSTHILYHIPHLLLLDSMDVSSPQMRDLAEGTVVKKKMYYNMRVKTTRRNLTTLLNRLNKDRRLLIQVPEERLRNIHFALKSIEQQQQFDNLSSEKDVSNNKIEELSCKDEDSVEHESKNADEGGGGEADESAMKKSCVSTVDAAEKISSIKKRIGVWKNKIEEIEEYHKQACDQLRELTSISESQLLLELETGGNVRFEQGSQKDIWFSTCHDLVISRFCAWDYKNYDISGIKTHRIIRVHNRLLRSRFDEKVHELACDETGFMISKNYKRLVDYLFFVWDSSIFGSIDGMAKVVEKGFYADETKSKDPVSLSNSLFLSEKNRLDHCVNRAKNNKFSDPSPFRHGRVVVAKVFLGKSAPAQDSAKISQEKYYKIDSVYRLRSDGSNLTSFNQDDCECSSRQCEWYVFDKDLVLPEYIIDFEYYTKQKPLSAFQTLNRSDADWSLDGANMIPNDMTAKYQADMDLDNSVIDMEPKIRPRPRILSLSEDLLLKMGHAMSVSQITVLNLHGNGLGRLKGIGTLSQLRYLAVSFNELTRLEDIAHMPNLVEVDASFNKINSLEGMRGLSKLTGINLSWNQLTSLRDDLTVMRKHCPQLAALDIRSNPWIKADNLFLRVIGRLKSLTTLNNITVTESDAASALRLVSGSRISLVTVMNHSRTDVGKPQKLSLKSNAQLMCEINEPKPDLKDPNWMSKVTVLNLDGQFIGKLTGLEKLENLRYATFNQNRITKLEGLENCSKLLELSLEDNCIYKLDGLSKLVSLRHLNLSSNYLVSFDNSGLENLTDLLYLCVENNRLTSLKGLSTSHSLVELYLGNNRIINMREIFHLKGLASLVILDVFGNPVIRSESYRLFVIYHLQNLKALDGTAIETSEESAAKDTFGGRLTNDFVAEHLGHANFADVRELDFPHCSIRTIDLGNGEAFKNLRSINLEHNSLTSFSGLVSLRHLRVLCLNHNHIECVVPRSKNMRIQIRSQYSVSHQMATDILSHERLTPIMESLEVLHLGYNKINNMAVLQLSRLTNLKALFLQGNEISKIEGLEGLHELRELVLDRNKVKVISDKSFISQWNLQELHLEENRVRDLGNLHHLENLQRLYLGMNRIQDMLELEKIEALPNLIELSVIGNAVSRRLLHRPVLVFQQPNLQTIDGIPVTPEERTKAELYFSDQQTNVVTESMLPGISPHNRAGPIKVTHMSIANDRHPLPYPNDHDPPRVNLSGNKKKHSLKDNHGSLPQGSLYSQLAGIKYNQQQQNYSVSNQNYINQLQSGSRGSTTRRR